MLSDLARGWPARRRWSPSYLREAHGELPIEAYILRGGRVVLDPRTGFGLARMSLGDYASEVERLERAGEAPRHYLRARLDGFPELAPYLGVPAPCRGGRGLRTNLWFSAAGTVSALHFDLPDNLVVQLYGRKRFTLFSRDDTRALAPHPPWSSTPHLARVDPDAPDFDRWPLLSRARPMTCVLSAGDALYIPRRMWHHARSLSAAISVNFWWCDRTTYPALLASDLYKRLRGLNI